VARLSDILGVLPREPFHVPPEQAARLTLDQIDLIVRDRDDGEAARRHPLSPRDHHRLCAVLERLPPWEEERVWAERYARLAGEG
jgi:adenylosuccinate synthase